MLQHERFRCHLVDQAFFSFSDVVVDLPKKDKVLIDRVTGRAMGGRVLALMGPSGTIISRLERRNKDKLERGGGTNFSVPCADDGCRKR